MLWSVCHKNLTYYSHVTMYNILWQSDPNTPRTDENWFFCASTRAVTPCARVSGVPSRRKLSGYPQPLICVFGYQNNSFKCINTYITSSSPVRWKFLLRTSLLSGTDFKGKTMQIYSRAGDVFYHWMKRCICMNHFSWTV